MGLDRYEGQARMMAGELLDLLTEEEHVRVQAIVEENSRIRPWQHLRRQDMDAAARLLCATPAQRLAKWRRLHPDDRLILWLRARALGLQSANAIALAGRVADIEGMKLRDGVRDIAQSILRYTLHPEPEDLLGLTPGEDE